MLVHVTDLKGERIQSVEVGSEDQLRAKISHMISAGFVKEGYRLNSFDKYWIVRKHDGKFTIKQVTRDESKLLTSPASVTSSAGHLTSNSALRGSGTTPLASSQTILVSVLVFNRWLEFLDRLGFDSTGYGGQCWQRATSIAYCTLHRWWGRCTFLRVD